MELTRAEFCRFNVQSRLKLLKKDGLLLAKRNVYNKYAIKLYMLYRFYVEVVVNMPDKEVIRIDPVVNPDILALY